MGFAMSKTILTRKTIFSVIAIVAGLSLTLVARIAFAGTSADRSEQPSPLHPNFALLDKNGSNVLDSGEAVSTLKTCGQCHDADFITSHSYHSDAGLANFGIPEQPASVTPWDSSDGLFGKWDPMLYRYLTVQGDNPLDLSTPEWIQTYGLRHVGGGPAVLGRDGQPLELIEPSIQDPEASYLNSRTEKLRDGIGTI